MDLDSLLIPSLSQLCSAVWESSLALSPDLSLCQTSLTLKITYNLTSLKL